MISRWRRLLPLLLAALWLPLQAASALAMPYCRHATVPAEAVAMAEMPCHEQGMDMAAMDMDDDGGTPAGGLAGHCDNCESCHLAGAAFMPACEATAAAVPPARIYSMRIALAQPSHIPEPPQRPPRPAA